MWSGDGKPPRVYRVSEGFVSNSKAAPGPMLSVDVEDRLSPLEFPVVPAPSAPLCFSQL